MKRMDWKSIQTWMTPLAAGRRLSPKVAEKQATLLKQWGALRWRDDLLGFALAPKRTDGEIRDIECVRIYVRKKKATGQLRAAERIPKYIRWPRGNGSEIEVVTDVLELGGLPQAQRRLGVGESVGHFLGTAGAIGLFVRANSKNYLLTCGHVAGPPDAKVKDVIESPADNSGTAGPNAVARLTAWQDFKPNLKYELDAALCELPPLSENLQYSNSGLGLSSPAAFATITQQNENQYREHKVQRISFGTRHDGVFDGVENNVLVEVGNMDVFFSGVYSYRCSNRRGDSGSPVIDIETHELLGLHFAGREAEQISFICPYFKIQKKLNVSIL